MAVIAEAHGTKPRFFSPSPLVDGAGNLFIAVIFNTGYDETTYVKILKKPSTGGPVIEVASQQSLAGKEDNCGMCRSGADLHVILTSHQNDPNAFVEHFAFPGLCVPVTGADQGGPAGAPLPGGNTPPPPAPDPTPSNIQADVRAVMGVPSGQTLAQQWGTNFGGNPSVGYREVVLGKAKQAIEDKQVLTLLMTVAGGDYGYYMQQINTAYTGCLGALHEAGMINAAQANAAAKEAVAYHNEQQQALLTPEGAPTAEVPEAQVMGGNK